MKKDAINRAVDSLLEDDRVREPAEGKPGAKPNSPVDDYKGDAEDLQRLRQLNGELNSAAFTIIGKAMKQGKHIPTFDRWIMLAQYALRAAERMLERGAVDKGVDPRDLMKRINPTFR
jgi:hypothetical protein